MNARKLMIQGTGSFVGKSILATALCRIFKQDGFRVAPYKSQNMSLNSFVTKEGGEMGRAQVVQAEAAGIEPTVDMNPILLKPEAEARSQIVVLGKPWATVAARDYYRYTPELLEIAMESLRRLCLAYDIVVLEGAGSPAEINLRRHEIVNMRVARLAQAPVLLVGDIDKGGVFASLVGTLTLLDPEERERIKGFIINKFRGEIAMLQSGLDQLERLTSKPVIGVVPYFHDIFIAQEDSIYTEERAKDQEASVDIAVIHLPHISNSTDFEALQQEDGASVRYITSAQGLGSPDAIILPGTKSTISDLAYLKQTGLVEAIVQRARAGTPVVGICGGYQMLGKRIYDPQHVESPEDSVAGLGLLNVITLFETQKTTCQVKAEVICDKGLFEGMKGLKLSGYEIHMGQTTGEVYSLFRIIQRPDGKADYPDGAVDEGGKVFGTYLHGLFDNEAFRDSFLAKLRQRQALPQGLKKPLPTKEEQYDKLAHLVRRSLNMKLVYQACGLGGVG